VDVSDFGVVVRVGGLGLKTKGLQSHRNLTCYESLPWSGRLTDKAVCPEGAPGLSPGFQPREQTLRIRTLKGCKIEWPTNR
jgi:hypothetical protein